MKYALKKARRIRVYDKTTDEHKVTLNDLKKIALKTEQETVYAEGADGARLAGFDTNKTSNITAENGAIETGYIALAVGSDQEVIADSNDISIRETKKVGTGADAGKIVLAHVARGTSGKEIKFIYATDVNGNPSSTKLTQIASGDDAGFTYDAATKTITINEAGLAIIPAGTEVAIDYYPKFKTVNAIKNDADKFSMTGKVVVDGWFTDLCSQADVPLQIVAENGKISGAFDLEFGDQAAVQNIEIEAMSSACAGDSKNLWKMYDYDMNEIDDTVANG